MSRKEVELILNHVLLALQFCLGLWQIIKPTRVGALIQGLSGCFHLSTTYARLQCFRGDVFKRVNCFELQADFPSDRTGMGIVKDGVNVINLVYLGRYFLLERKGREGNMLFIDGKMCYYISHQIWEELQILGEVLLYGVPGPAAAAAAATTDVCADAAAVFAASRVAIAARLSSTVFLNGRYYWGFGTAVISGYVMTLEEVLDEVIIYNQHVGVRLRDSDDLLLPDSFSASGEKFLQILNLIALFQQNLNLIALLQQTEKVKVHWLIQTIMKAKVHWLIPTSLSFISALMEFSSRIRVWLCSNIDLSFCNMMHWICDPLPRSWRRKVYSFGKLQPCNDIQLKVVRGNICAPIAGGAKVEKQGATVVPWLTVPEGNFIPDPVVERQFHCSSIDTYIKCIYYGGRDMCYISAANTSGFSVDCKSMTDFQHIITFVSSIAKNGCGSLKCYGPNNTVSVRGFRESIISYVNSGLLPVYELELNNVVMV